jgi:Mg2+-importing ATPase
MTLHNAGRQISTPFWSLPTDQLLAELDTDPQQGLSDAEAAARLSLQGPNLLVAGQRTAVPVLLLRQFSSPIMVIVLIAVLLSFALNDATDGAIILVIVVVSGVLGFWQEQGAAQAMAALLRSVELQARVRRGGRELDMPTHELVRGDVVLVPAGDGIPADCRLLEECDLFVNEAALTGESFPVDKSPGLVKPGSPLAERSNVLMLGTHVVSGSGLAVVVRTRRPLMQSPPSRLLMLATLLVVAGTVALPYTPMAGLLGFVPLPQRFLGILALIVLVYGVSAELAMRWFYSNHANTNPH